MTTEKASPTLYVGLMSGTSLDGLDIALCEMDAAGKPRLLTATSQPLPENLAKRLLALTSSNRNELHEFGLLDREFAVFCAHHVAHFLKQHEIAPEEIIAIGSHGQTVRHMPDNEPGFSLQLGCPSTLAALTGIDVIANFRQKDIALGGQGAPLAPAFHRAMLFEPSQNRAIVNIGGIANVSLVSKDDDTFGFDTGPGNCLMDSWFQQNHPESTYRYDLSGQWAASGSVNRTLLQRLLGDSYFRRTGPKSSGREYFHLNWLSAYLSDEKVEAADVQRTLLELTAQSIADSILAEKSDSVFICGGGVHNELLMERLATLLKPAKVASTAELGLSPDWVEAMAFAWLAWCFINNKASNLPAVTGASRRAVLGGLYKAD